MIELSIKVKTSERTQTHKHVLYDPITLDKEDKVLQALVQEAIKLFGEEPEEVSVRTLYFW
jgi:hypothetical protein